MIRLPPRSTLSSSSAASDVYKRQGILSDKSKLITFYGLCGFANFSSVGILVSGMGAMAPERKEDLIEVSFQALVGATLASCMTGLIVGCLI